MNLGVDVFVRCVTPELYRPGIGLRLGGERRELEALVTVFTPRCTSPWLLTAVWGVRSRSLRCDELVLVNESSEDVVTLKLHERHIGCHLDRAAIRCDEAETTMRSVLVVVTDVDGQDTVEMVVTDDKQVVEALAPNGAYPSLGECARHRGSYPSNG